MRLIAYMILVILYCQQRSPQSTPLVTVTSIMSLELFYPFYYVNLFAVALKLDRNHHSAVSAITPPVVYASYLAMNALVQYHFFFFSD